MPYAAVISGRYMAVKVPGHHRANANGYVLEHILVAESALGRPLSAKHPVHHVDQNKRHNASGNLVICESSAYHNLIHRRMRAMAACGDPSARLCFLCGRYDRQDDITESTNSHAYHGSCNRAYQARRRTAAKEVAA